MKYELAKGVQLEQVGNEVVATLPSGDMVVLNESAAIVLQSLEGDEDDQVAQAAAMLELAFGLSFGKAYSDAGRALSQLRSAGVLMPKRNAKPLRSHRDGLGRRTFVTCMAAAGLGLLSPGTALGKTSASPADEDVSTANNVKEGRRGNSRVWTDALGRKVKLPKEIVKVAPYGPYAQSFMETIDPDMVVQVAARGMHASVADNASTEAEELANQAGTGASLSALALDQTSPDLVLDIAVSKERLCPDVESRAWTEGVPVVHLVASHGHVPEAYRLLGDLLGREERCEELADYIATIDSVLAQVRESVPEDERLTVYYGGAPDGLSTRGEGTLMDDVIKSVGALNYADSLGAIDLKNVPVGLLAMQSPDIAVLNVPDYFTDEETRKLIDGVWGSSTIDDALLRSAIVPSEPMPWLGAAPLVMQTLGAVWLADVVYPELVKFNIEEFADECFDMLFCIDAPDPGQLSVAPARTHKEKGIRHDL